MRVTLAVKDMVKSYGLLLLVALIWGFAFVAQRSGMEVIGPFAFSGVRFALMSTGVAYTLQVVVQRKAHPAHASIILSMEALFAAIGGVMILHEPVTLRLVAGGALMFAGMTCSQMKPRKHAAQS